MIKPSEILKRCTLEEFSRLNIDKTREAGTSHGYSQQIFDYLQSVEELNAKDLEKYYLEHIRAGSMIEDPEDKEYRSQLIKKINAYQSQTNNKFYLIIKFGLYGRLNLLSEIKELLHKLNKSFQESFEKDITSSNTSYKLNEEAKQELDVCFRYYTNVGAVITNDCDYHSPAGIYHILYKNKDKFKDYVKECRDYGLYYNLAGICCPYFYNSNPNKDFMITECNNTAATAEDIIDIASGSKFLKVFSSLFKTYDYSEKESIKEEIVNALKAIDYLKNNNLAYNETWEALCKTIVLYYGAAEIFLQNEYISFEMCNNFIQHVEENTEFYTTSDDTGRYKIVSLSEYPRTNDDSDILYYQNIDNQDLLYKYIDDTQKRSLEAVDTGMNFGKRELEHKNMQEQNFAINKVDAKYKGKFEKMKKIFNEVFKVKPAKLKQKINSMYFKKWYGRIPGMYQRYGDEAKITENKMKGDPTLILANSAPKYLANLVEETNKLFNEIISLGNKIVSAGDIQAKVNVVKNWCNTYKIEDPSDPDSIETGIKNECTFRIAQAIFQDNGIYGYTPEGIVENGKFPTANHIVTSLFIDNAHEEPEEQSVSNIFSKPESILIYAHPEKIATYDELFKKSTASITHNFSDKITSSVVKNLDTGYKNYTRSLSLKSKEVDSGDAENASLNKKIYKAIENGLEDGLDIIIDQKARCIQCSGAMYDMLTRVQRLAKMCVASLHEVEVAHGDKRMNAGINDSTRNATNARLNKINSGNTLENKYHVTGAQGRYL